MTRRLGTLAVVLVTAGCGKTTAADYGAEIFEDPSFSKSKFNDVSCATCHDTNVVSKYRVHIGYPLEDSAFRESYWGGGVVRLLDAINVCYVDFMRGDPLNEDDVRGRALYEYLVHLSPRQNMPTLPFTVVENVRLLARGNPERGEKVYARACARCHGDKGSGDDRLTDDMPLIPNEAVDYAKANHVDAALVVIEKVRHGPFFGVGGNMPLFSREALSDADLGALLAYLRL